MTVTFRAEVKIDGINPFVVVPSRLHDTVKSFSGGRVLVRVASVDKPAEVLLSADYPRLKAIGRLTPDGWFRTTLVTRRSTLWLFLDTWMRDASGSEVGDTVKVTMNEDPGARQMDMPLALVQALDASPKAMEAWEGQSPSRQREILSYLNFLKTDDAIRRNVEKTIDKLIHRKRQR